MVRGNLVKKPGYMTFGQIKDNDKNVSVSMINISLKLLSQNVSAIFKLKQ